MSTLEHNLLTLDGFHCVFKAQQEADLGQFKEGKPHEMAFVLLL